MKRVEVEVGTIRVEAKTLQSFIKTKTSWKKYSCKFPELNAVVKVFRSHNKFDVLVDTKNPRFLKGSISKQGEVKGARINVLPDGQILNKAFSLFSHHLTIHDQSSHDHWDVIYQNKGGTFAYCYTKEKIESNKDVKYKKVERFSKHYKTLYQNARSALNDKNDHLALPMYTLLTTYMRIGNEQHYKAHGHKGLTTLTKADVSVKDNQVTFNYLAKDGVPRKIVQRFPPSYCKRLSRTLNQLKKNEFVFHNPQNNHPLSDRHFKQAFLKYCGEEFYPHIVRSHFATMQVKHFLKEHRKISKEQAKDLFLSIAADLGHSKFVKKDKVWKTNYNVTVNHYIQPSLVSKVKRIAGL